MKRALLLLVFLPLLFVSCKKEEFSFLPESHWQMTYVPAAESRTELFFKGTDMTVVGSNQFVTPLEDDVWCYYLSENGSRMHISRYYYDVDGTWTNESYAFSLTLSNNDTEMQLVYKPLIGQTRTLLFSRI